MREMHGLAKTPTHISWMAMNARCNRPKHKYYPNYGGRGIKVCPEWKSFTQFVKDMGFRPDGASLERLDSNKDYSPSNCVWATRTEQNRNTTQNKNITYKGQTKCLAAWCEQLNLNYARTYARIFKLNWTLESAFNEPRQISPHAGFGRRPDNTEISSHSVT